MKLALLLAVLLAAAPAGAVPKARVFVDAGARTAALSKLLRDEGLAELVGASVAELRIQLNEKGTTWALAISDRHGASVLRRDVSAAGGELAALRVVAVLVEQATRTLAARSVPVVRSATVADPRGQVRAVPPVPIPETAVLLLEDASALPKRVRGATVAPARGPEPRSMDVPPRPAGTSTRASVAPADPGSPAVATTSPADDPPASPAPEALTVATPEPSAAALPERLVEPPDVPSELRFVAGLTAHWWSTPAAVPQLGLALGAEHPLGPVVLGLSARVAGIPCCRRTSELLQATALELGGAAYGHWPFVAADPIGLMLFSELALAYVGGSASLVLGTPGVVATTTALNGFVGGFAVGAAIELMLGRRASLRVRAGARVALATVQVAAPAGLVGEPLDSGRVTPTVDLSVPFSW